MQPCNLDPDKIQFQTLWVLETGDFLKNDIINKSSRKIYLE